MYWINHAETVDTTPFWQAINQSINKTLPPYWDKQQVDLYASLTEPLAQYSTAWLTYLAQGFKLMTPPAQRSEATQETEHWLAWMVQGQQQLWMQWTELSQSSSALLADAMNDSVEQVLDVQATVMEVVEISPVETSLIEATKPEPISTKLATAVPVKATKKISTADDLTVINGIGPALARKLNEAGIKTYADIGAWSASDIETIEQTVLGGRFVGRIERDDWVGQALALSVGN
jgi:predicted flap endonuclease-1-like 5' DNA nuclease